MLGDFAHAYMYAQRTADDRIALGGRGVPYRFGSRTDTDGATQPATVRQLREILHEFFPAARTARIEHAWAGVLGVPRDWCATVDLDRRTGLGWVGRLRRQRRHHHQPGRPHPARPRPRPRHRTHPAALGRPHRPPLGARTPPLARRPRPLRRLPPRRPPGSHPPPPHHLPLARLADTIMRQVVKQEDTRPRRHDGAGPPPCVPGPTPDPRAPGTVPVPAGAPPDPAPPDLPLGRGAGVSTPTLFVSVTRNHPKVPILRAVRLCPAARRRDPRHDHPGTVRPDPPWQHTGPVCLGSCRISPRRASCPPVDGKPGTLEAGR